jgi:Secretion system C-terminal sorting domain
MKFQKLSSFLVGMLIVLFTAGFSFATDFYVGTDGIDAEDQGSTAENPFRSILFALSVAYTDDNIPHTIYVADGTYGDWADTFPLPIIDDTSIIGESAEGTILDASNAPSQANVIEGSDVDNWNVENLTIMGGHLYQGAGVSIYGCENVSLSNVIIRNNSAIFGNQGIGGGVYIFNSDNVSITNALILNNTAYEYGGGVLAYNCSPVLTNVTMAGNSTVSISSTNAIYSNNFGDNEIIIMNSIIWGNPDPSGMSETIDGPVNITYSVVENDVGVVWPGTGNSHEDPLFIDRTDNDYSLLFGSVAIDHGDPASDYSLEPAPNGDRVNAGYYGNSEMAQLSGAQYRLNYNQWSFIGLPVDSPDGDPEVLFGDEFAGQPTGDYTWRLMHYNSILNMFIRYDEVEEDGIEYGDPPDLTPGRGYLIQQKLDGRVTLDVPGHALPQDDDFSIDLEVNGTNSVAMVANPYPYSININETRLNVFSTNFTFDAAADAGHANRWMYNIDPSGKFIPNYGSIDPWEGGIIFSLLDTDMSWEVTPDRNEPVSQDPLMDQFDWVLPVVVSAVDSLEIIVEEYGNFMGISGQMANVSDGVDPFDAYYLDYLYREFKFYWVSGPEDTPLLYDFQTNDFGDYYHVWHGVAIGDTLMPDSLMIELENLISDTLQNFYYPDSAFGFRLETADSVIIEPDLRFNSIVKIPFELQADSTRRTEFRIVVTHPNWVSDIDEDDPDTVLPETFTLESVYPNPFNGSTTIAMNLPSGGDVSVKIYDVLGRQVEKLSFRQLGAGTQRFVWQPNRIASGVYFLKAKHGETVSVKKVVLLQ